MCGGGVIQSPMHTLLSLMPVLYIAGPLMLISGDSQLDFIVLVMMLHITSFCS